MSREEAAAKAVKETRWQVIQAPEGEYGSSLAQGSDVEVAEAALAAADAHDAANGVYRVTLDDATVERAARAIFPSYWDDDTLIYLGTQEAVSDAQRSCTEHVRDILAAAVKGDAE